MATQITWTGDVETDIRVKLQVPPNYTQGLGGGPASGRSGQRILDQNKGIIFPYTPTISYNNQAIYSAVAPTHSNYQSFFFKNSTAGPITITGKLTCQNEYEGAVILGIQHLLRALIKMRWGNEDGAGSPPPVCRLKAFGNSMLGNVPVVVQSWKLELPDGVDYIQVGDGITEYGKNFVPVVSTLTLELLPMYSRAEQLSYTVDDFLNGRLSNKGYL